MNCDIIEYTDERRQNMYELVIGIRDAETGQVLIGEVAAVGSKVQITAALEYVIEILTKHLEERANG